MTAEDPVKRTKEPGTSAVPRRAGQPFTGDLAAARAYVEAVVDWAAARTGTSRPGPEVIDAAVSILVVPPDRRDVSASAYPAIVWDVGGALVAVYYPGSPGGPAATAWCSCRGDGLCEHLLVALAETGERQ